MRNKKLLFNTVSSILHQITTIVCGFILPQMILKAYGSDVNGLMGSITNFLSMISFLDLGVGAVVRSSLYKPLAENDNCRISSIVSSANKFFRKIAKILLLYILVLIVIFPYISNFKFDRFYSAALIIAIGINSFAQYYFGIVDGLLLTADQRGYIQYTIQVVTLLLNVLVCFFLIRMGVSIQTVKLATSLIYLLRPALFRWYINKNYSIDRNIKYNEEPIKQKWNGMAQHIASIVMDGTDIAILTLFSTLSYVSVYSVYYLVISGIKGLIQSATAGMSSLLGELWAKKSTKELNKMFELFEWEIHMGAVFLFGCTFMLIVPFVQVYTKGVLDANYYQPLFAAVITLANTVYCLRMPYNMMILAAGHYKQTQHFYLIGSAVNIIVSVASVIKWGLVGVAVGTLTAMIVHTFWTIYYTSKNLIKWPLFNVAKQLSADIICFTVSSLLTRGLIMTSISYISWVVLAFKTALIWAVVIVIFNVVFCTKKLKRIFAAAK